MTDMQVIDPLTGETGRHLLTLLFEVENEWKESFDVGCGYIVAV